MSKHRRNKKKKNNIIIGIILVLLVIVLVILTNLISKQIEINNTIAFNYTPIEAEIHSKVSINDFHIEIENGKIVGEYDFSTAAIGKQKQTISIENKKGEISKYDLYYTVVDTKAPTLELPSSFTILALNGLSKQVVNDVVLANYRCEDNSLTCHITVDAQELLTSGVVTVTAADDSNNHISKQISIYSIQSVDGLYENTILADQIFYTEKGARIEIIDHVAYATYAEDKILIVNKSYAIPTTINPGSLLSETSTAFNNMKEAAKEAGYTLWNQSGFRSYNYQKSLYNGYVADRGQEGADLISARPGHSEHQTGLALDINSLTFAFANTPEGKWVNDHCWEYGFIIRFVKDKTDETGYAYEPWHIRYVGNIELAKELYNNGDWITVEDYFGLTSEYPF